MVCDRLAGYCSTAARTPPDDLPATTTAAERVEMVWQVTLDAWALAGRTIPDYPRNEAPVRVIRSGVRSAESDEGEPV